MDKDFDEIVNERRSTASKTTEITTKVTGKLKEWSFVLVALPLIVATILLTYVSLGISIKAQFKEVLINTVLLTACSYWFYLDFADYGLKCGYASKEYATALGTYTDVKKRIQEKNLSHLGAEWSSATVADELRTRRTDCLADACIPYQTYFDNKWYTLSRKQIRELKLDDSQRNAIIRANQCKPMRMSFQKLTQGTNTNSAKSKMEFRNPVDGVRYMRGARLIRFIITSFVVGSIVVKELSVGGWEALGICIFKIAMMVFSGFSGYMQHFKLVNESQTNYLWQLTDYLIAFEKWADSKVK